MSRIADEDVFFTFVIKLGSSFIWYMNMGYTFKYFKVRNSGLSSIPGFLRCLSLNTSCWRSVGQVDCCIHCFSPKFFRQMFAFEHASCHIKDGSIFSFCNTILLWRSWNSEKTPNSICCTELLEFL